VWCDEGESGLADICDCGGDFDGEGVSGWAKGNCVLCRTERQKFDERIVVSVTGCFASYELFHALNKMHEIGFQSVAVMPQGLAKHSLGELPTLNFYEADEAQRERVKNPQRGCPFLHLRHLDRPIIAT
jgi:hypothetical protein